MNQKHIDKVAKRQITLPHSDYQPSKAEKEKEYNMPKAKEGIVRSAFFQPYAIRRAPKGK